MFGKSLGSDKGKKTVRLKIKESLSFDIWKFRIGHADCDDNRIICSDDYNL
jgi:hypothetical protein